MKLFDASSIFNIIIAEKYDRISDASTIRLAEYELGNILWKNHTIRKTISLDELSELRSAMALLFESIELVENSLEETIELAVRERITFYDSSYLSAAREHNYDLVTNDEKLYRVAKKYLNAYHCGEV